MSDQSEADTAGDDGADLRAFQASMLEEVLTRRPLRLPRALGANESRQMYRTLGVGLRDRGDRIFLNATLPEGWKCRRLGSEGRWIEVCSEDGTPMIEALYKLTPYESRSNMRLTEQGLRRLAEIWQAEPRWRRLLGGVLHRSQHASR